MAIRADFDALPITEDTGLSFASQNKGVMRMWSRYAQHTCLY